MKVTLENGMAVIRVSFFENLKAKSVGARFHPSSKTWRVKLTKLTAKAISSTFDQSDIDPEILSLVSQSSAIPDMGADPNQLLKSVKLRPRQVKGIEKAWPHPGFALFWVMGAGKTLSSIALVNLRRHHGLIDRVLVVCPTSIKGVWKKEFDRYSGLPHDLFVMESGLTVPQFKDFPIMVVGVEALSQGGAHKEAEKFVSGGKCFTIIDESSTIKNHDANRTEKCHGLGESSEMRLILTGTNVTQGLEDLFSQMYFVDPTIIGELSYYAFRNKYCVLGGFENRKIVGYRDPQSLLDKIRPYCDVIRKSDLIDLPPKIYQTREVKASPAQVRACKELAKEMKTVLGDKVLTVQNTLEAALRFQQISGGFDPDGNPFTPNPKMAELLALLEEFDGKAIIWARYLPEVHAIHAELNKRWPGSCIKLHGEVPASERQPIVDEFEASNKQRFLVANQQTAGKGLTIIAATLSVYYSNTFSLEDREQSEDRNHRIGQKNTVVYVDLVSDLKIDKHVLSAIVHKKSLSEYANNGLKIDDLY